MRASIVIAATAVVIVAAGAGYYGLEVYPQQRFRTGLDQALATLPAGMTATYKTAHYSVAQHLAVLTGVTVHGVIQGNEPLPIDVSFDQVETSNPNLDFSAAWAAASVNPTTLAPDASLRLADSIAFKNAVIHASFVTVTEESGRLSNMRVYPWALLHDGLPAWKDVPALLAQLQGPQPMTPPTLDAIWPLLRADAALASGFAYDAYAAQSAKVVESLNGFSISYDVREVSADGYDRGMIKHAQAEGIKGQSSVTGAFSVDRVVIGESDMRAPLARIVNGEAPSPALLDEMKLGRIEYRGMTVQPPGMALTRLGDLSIGPIAFAHGVPVAAELAWTGVSVSKSQIPADEVREVFTGLNLDTMTVGFTTAFDWDVARNRASIHDTTLKVNELGTIALSADLANLGSDAASLSQARLAHARLRFDDASLVDRLLAMGAGKAGTDVPTYRRQIVAMVREQGAAGSNAVSPVMTAASQATGDFIQTAPHALTIELSPPAPVPFMALGGAANMSPALATLLGLTVSANQP